jgi:homoserine O-acetyltransferase
VGQPFAGLLRGAREWRVAGKYRLTAKPTSGTVAALADLVDVEQAAHRNFCALADNEVIKAVEKRTGTTRTKRRQPRKKNGGLDIAHLRLIIGSSMGGMHAWMWAEMYPDLMDGVVPISCQPVEISGRNWLSRRAQAEAIRHDPDWNNGFYETNPRHYIYAAAGNFGTESPTRIQEMAPTLAAANALYERRLAEAAKGDANDALWAIEAIQDYNPEPDLDKIKAKVLLINDAEDHANPPELGTVEHAMKRVKHGRYALMPAGPNTHGHFSHFYAELWKPYLIEFMQTLGTPLQAAAE